MKAEKRTEPLLHTRADGRQVPGALYFPPTRFEVHYTAAEATIEALGSLSADDLFRKTRVVSNQSPQADKEGLLVVDCDRENVDEFTQFLLELDRRATPESELCRLCCRPETEPLRPFGRHLDWPTPTCGHGSFLVHFECFKALDASFPNQGADRSAVFDRIMCPVCGCGSFYT